MVTAIDHGKLGASISTPDFKTMISGVATTLGGEDQGPTPHE